MGPPPSRFSFAVAPLPGMSVLRWRHPLFGWTACCMPPDHCVGILHLPHHRCCPCFDRCTRRHCLLSHSHPHYFLRHHCSLCHHRPLHHHQMKGCHPRFLLLAHLEEHVPGLRGDLSLPLSAIHALGLTAAWPFWHWRRWWCLRLRQWSWWTWRWWRWQSRRQWY